MGRKLLKEFENCGWDGAKVFMDKVYEGDETHQLVLGLGMEPVVPPKRNQLSPWEYDRELYKKLNEMEISPYIPMPQAQLACIGCRVGSLMCRSFDLI